MKLPPEWKNHLPIALVLLIGLIVRLQFAGIPVVFDEVFQMWTSPSISGGWLPVVNFGLHLENSQGVLLNHPPLAPLLYGAAFKIFGTSAAVARLVLTGFSVAKIFLVYLTCSLFLGKKRAVLSAGTYAMAFEGVASDIDVNYGSVAYFFILVFVYLLLKQNSEGKIKKMACAVPLGFALFTFIIPPLVAWTSIFLSSVLLKEQRKNIRPLIGVLALGIAVYMELWVVYLLFSGGSSMLFFMPLDYLATKAGVLGSGLFNLLKIAFSVILKPADLAAPIVFSLLSAVAIARAQKKQALLALSSAIFVFLVFLMSFVAYSGYSTRYIGSAYPFMAIVLAIGLAKYANSKETFKYALAALVFLSALLVSYQTRLGSYFWISTKTSPFLLWWYLPMAIALLLVLFSFASKDVIKPAGMLCAAVFVAYTLASYIAFYMGLPVMSVGGGYYSRENGILEASDLAGAHIGTNNFVIAPPDVAYHANLTNRYLDTLSTLIYDGIGRTPVYDVRTFDRYNISAVVIPRNEMGSVPKERMAEIRSLYRRVEKAGTYYVFSR